MVIFEKIQKALFLIYKAGDNTVEHDGIENAGFLAFMGILALFPFLVFFFSLLGVLGQTENGTELINWMVENANENLTRSIAPSIRELLDGPPEALLTVSILGTIWTSSSMVEGIRTALNKAYRVHTPPNYWLRRLFSVGQIFLLSVILIGAMFAFVFAPIAFEKVYAFFESFNAASGIVGSSERIEFDFERLSFLGVEWVYIRYAGVITVMIFCISSLYYFLPNVKHSWLKTLPGATIAALAWLGIGKSFSYFLSHFDRLNLIYGSLGSIIAFLLFFYIINIIFIYGAEFNYLLRKQKGEESEEREEVAPEDVKEKEKYLDIKEGKKRQNGKK